MKRMLSLLGLVSLLSLVLVSQVLAAEIRGSGRAEVRADEIIDDDLYIAGTAVNIAGTVNGDVVAAGGSVNVSGRIMGNLFAFGQTVTVSGTVDGGVFGAGQTIVLSGEVVPTVRVAAQSLVVQGKVGRDLLVAGQAVTLESGGVVGQDVLIAAQDAQLLGNVGRKLTGEVESLTIGGATGEVDVTAQRVTLLPGASVSSLTYRSAQDARIESGAVVTGTVTRLDPPERAEPRDDGLGGQILSRLFWFLATLVTGVVLLALVPAFVRQPAQALWDAPLPSLGWGALLFVVTPIAVLIAMVTIIGIPLGLLVLFAYLAVLFLSQVFVGLFIGRLILQQEPADGIGRLIGALALGLLVLMVIFVVVGLIPFLGGLINLAILVFGLGGAWLAAVRARPGPRQVEVIG